MFGPKQILYPYWNTPKNLHIVRQLKKDGCFLYDSYVFIIIQLVYAENHKTNKETLFLPSLIIISLLKHTKTALNYKNKTLQKLGLIL